MPRPARRLAGPPLPQGPVVIGLETGGFHLGLSLWRLPEACGEEQGQWHLLEVMSMRLGHRHAKTLLPQVDAMLARQEIEASEVALIGVGRGPGGFTGIRVGMSTALGMAAGLGATVWPVDSLAVLARHAAGHQGVVAPLIDARKNEVYGGAYRVPLDGPPECIVAPMVGSRDKVMNTLMTESGDDAPLVFGSGSLVYGGASKVPPSYHVPCAGHTGWLAARAWEQGGRDASLAPSIDPAYVRPSDAELEAKR